MNNITQTFSQVYVPQKALLIYDCYRENSHNINTPDAHHVYVESYDIGADGRPRNAHPLTLKESLALAQLLGSSSDMQNGFLRPRDLMPLNALHVNPHGEGYAVWYTPPKVQPLFFTEGLTIPCGKAFVPALLWKATRNHLQVFALKGNKRPTLKTALHHAPFFNISSNGGVCMGTVSIDIDRTTRLEDFMAQWERYFFNSYFSHGLDGGGLTNVNIVQLWRQLIASGERFPETALKPISITLKQLLL